MKPVIGIHAEALTPFYYHGLYARDGSTTHPNVITDTAFVFALRAALLGPPWGMRAEPDYKGDLKELPWRASLLLGERNTLMMPIRHAIDVEREGGYTEKMQKDMGSGNFKKIFFTHSVRGGATYRGILIGPNPFDHLGLEGDQGFVIRVGVGRQGMLLVRRQPIKPEETVHLNTATGLLFDRPLAEAWRILDTIRFSQPLSIMEAADELHQWY